MTQPNLPERARAVLDFWLGPIESDDQPSPPEKSSTWYTRSDVVDHEIRERFGADLEAAREGRLDAWAETPRGRLALVIVLDQFSRNLYRDSGEAFAKDPVALSLTLDAIERGWDRELFHQERVFLYMPLMHAEDRAAQARGVQVFERLAEEARGPFAAAARNNLEYAIRHQRVVDRFGRFPHRNEVLGRESTPEELEHLAKGKPF